ncbi:MAG: DUF3788 family protein [Lachnospiraceae bacterium]|nr:DUF3788 family protein [Lachnospiraceae bacterium]
MTELEKVSHETMKFMRGKYRLDEVPGKYYDIDCLKFRQGKKTILSINIHENHYDFQIIFGKAECAKFEAQRDEFPKEIQDLYDKERTLHDGKWMLIRVDNMAMLEVVKKLIMIKKKPNRKPFPKENAVHSGCGHRCDLCIHYEGMNDELRSEIEPRLTRVWGQEDWNMRCDGCLSDNCHCKDNPCDQKRCAAEKKIKNCRDCAEYPCINATVGDNTSMIHTNAYLADDITWAILPYVPMQYENV